MATGNEPSAGNGKRPRSPTRLVVVQQVKKLTPLVTQVTFGGDQLAGFGPPRPGSHMKLLFAPEGSGWTPQDEQAPRPPRRTYTPRRYDPDRLSLDIEFVHHGPGLAARWAERARPDQQLYVTGPGGGYEIPEGASDIVLVADDTALPAAATILESMVDNRPSHLFFEVANAAEERAVCPGLDLRPTWLHRETRNAAAGLLLEEAVRGFTASTAATHWWIACEATAMRRIRNYLLRDVGVAAARIHTRGYWKLGETAYPDHDYGKD